jgi:hypothetical protein
MNKPAEQPSLEIAHLETGALEKQSAQTETERMFAMIERMATDPQVDPAKLREILSVKQAWEADESRKAFASAMAKFQSLCPIIEKLDTANGRGYARLDRIHRETRPLLRDCGLWFSWTVCEERDGGLIHLEGILGHSSGHQVPCRQLISLPDKISGTNAAQRAGSGQTYAKRYGELAALNVVTGDDNDGNSRKERPVGPAARPAANPSAPSAPQKETFEELKKKLSKELWDLLKPTVSQVAGWNPKTWDGHNQWLFREDILDGGIPEVMPDLKPERIAAVIGLVKERI